MRRLFNLDPGSGSLVLRALAAVSRAGGVLSLHPIHRETLIAIDQHVLGSGTDVDVLDGRIPDGLEAALSDDDLRRTVLHVAVVLPFLAAADQPARVRTLEALGRCLGLSDPWVADAKRAAHGHYVRLGLHCMREVRTMSHSTIASELAEVARSALRIDADPELRARYAALERLPAGTAGRELLRYYEDNAFLCPGEAGSWQSRVFLLHDVAHVLSGYDTTPDGEFGVEAFTAGSSPHDLIGFTMLIVMQFQRSVPLDPSVPTWRDQFHPEVYFAGLERGAACTLDLADPELDPWPLFEEPLEALRDRLGIPAEGAMVRSLDDRWCGALGPPKDRESPDRTPSRIGG